MVYFAQKQGYLCVGDEFVVYYRHVVTEDLDEDMYYDEEDGMRRRVMRMRRLG